MGFWRGPRQPGPGLNHRCSKGPSRSLRLQHVLIRVKPAAGTKERVHTLNAGFIDQPSETEWKGGAAAERRGREEREREGEGERERGRRRRGRPVYGMGFSACG